MNSALLYLIEQLVTLVIARLVATSIHRCIEKDELKATTLGYLFTKGDLFKAVESDVDLAEIQSK